MMMMMMMTYTHNESSFVHTSVILYFHYRAPCGQETSTNFVKDITHRNCIKQHVSVVYRTGVLPHALEYEVSWSSCNIYLCFTQAFLRVQLWNSIKHNISPWHGKKDYFSLKGSSVPVLTKTPANMRP
jgi:hypothetical protein